MSADPISCWPVLLRLAPAPSPVEALRRYGAHLLGPVYRTLRSGRLARAAPSCWREGHKALAAVYGLGRATSSLAVQPDRWATFHEPQITGGLAYFLEDCARPQRHARIAALFEVAGAGLPGTDPDRIERASATAEASLDTGRIDLLVKAQLTSGQTFCLLIEAKFGHVLGERQLGGYQAAIAAAADCLAADITRVVVAPTLNERLRAGLRDAPDWRFLTWVQFVLRLDAALPADADDADFRRFRRTIWHRAHA